MKERCSHEFGESYVWPKKHRRIARRCKKCNYEEITNPNKKERSPYLDDGYYTEADAQTWMRL